VGAEMYNSCWFINTLNNSANYLYHCFIIKYFYLVSKWYVCVLIKRCWVTCTLATNLFINTYFIQLFGSSRQKFN
jgi:hypothetical protein